MTYDDFEKAVGVTIMCVGIVGGTFLAVWLGGYVMLYGGIVGAIDAGTSSSMALQIIKACCCGFGFVAGAFAGILVTASGREIYH